MNKKRLINKIKNIFNNKEVRILFENFISLSTLQLVGAILPLVTLPYVLRVLGFSSYGLIVFAFSLIAYFQSVTDYSFKITATRDVAIFRDSPKKLNLIYSKVIVVKFLFLILSFFIIGLIVYLYKPFYEERLIFYLAMPLLFGYALFPEWFFQGIEKMKYITILNIVVKLFFTIGVFVFIKEKEDYWIYPLLYSGGYIIAGLIGQYILVKKYGLRFIWLKKRIIKQTIITNFPIFINQFSPALYNNTTTFLLGIMTTTHFVGIYDAIKKIIDISISLLNIISRVFFPFLNRKQKYFSKYKNIMLITSSSFVIIILIFNKLIFWYLNIDYEYEFEVLFVLSLGIIGYTFYDIFGLNYFIIKRQDKLVMRNAIKASIIGLILAFPLINFFGIIGAAINLTISRFLMGGLLVLKWKKDDRN